jgi:hypothetical protein
MGKIRCCKRGKESIWFKIVLLKILFITGKLRRLSISLFNLPVFFCLNQITCILVSEKFLL